MDLGSRPAEECNVPLNMVVFARSVGPTGRYDWVVCLSQFLTQ